MGEMKRALVVALVVAVLFTGIPMLMVMSGLNCVDCDLAMAAATGCVLGVLAATLLVAFALFGVPLRMRPVLHASLLATSGLDRPPRLS